MHISMKSYRKTLQIVVGIHVEMENFSYLLGDGRMYKITFVNRILYLNVCLYLRDINVFLSQGFIEVNKNALQYNIRLIKRRWGGKWVICMIQNRE